MKGAKSVRLNNEMRDKFKKAVREDSLGERPQLRDFTKKLAPHVYKTYFEKYEQRVADAPGWACHSTKSLFILIPVEFAAGYSSKPTTMLSFKLPSRKIMFRQLKDEGYSYNNADRAGPVAGELDTVTVQYKEYLRQEKDWETKKQTLTEQLKKLIDPLNTTEQLYKAWPEAKKYSDCFPFIPKKIAKTEVSKMEMNITTKMMKATVTDLQQEN